LRHRGVEASKRRVIEASGGQRVEASEACGQSVWPSSRAVVLLRHAIEQMSWTVTLSSHRANAYNGLWHRQGSGGGGAMVRLGETCGLVSCSTQRSVAVIQKLVWKVYTSFPPQ
jgi:hypothetical protein